MGKVIANISMSLDGFIAGPKPTLEEPLGVGGEQLHEWVVRLASWRESHGMSGGDTGPDNDVMEEITANIGAVIMGRRMFSGGEGPWEADPNADGWWGENPPFHVPVFVLTSHKRGDEIKEGGTIFHFVNDDITSAMSQAREVAKDKDISIAGGANTIQQCINTDLLDELHIHIAPAILDSGTRLLAGVPNLRLEQVDISSSKLVTHIRYKVL